MPIVLTQNEITESGHDYADVLGVSYEYPKRYWSIITAGERFVYYRGRRSAAGGTQPQAYLGVGVIGGIRESSSPGRLICHVEDYQPFVTPLAFKVDGAYLESGAEAYGSHSGLYFRSGVRRIRDDEFANILEAAGHALEGGSPAPSVSYASPEVSRLVDTIAMEQAIAEAYRSFPGMEICRMPQNNPGFDILIQGEAFLHYIEVKGTTRSRPHFFMSEGERRFSIARAQSYSLWVIYDIDIAAGRGTFLKRGGAVDGMGAGLTPRQWSGCLPLP